MLKSPVETRTRDTVKPVQMDQRSGRTAAPGSCESSTRAQAAAFQPGAEPRAFVQRQLEIGVRLEG